MQPYQHPRHGDFDAEELLKIALHEAIDKHAHDVVVLKTQDVSSIADYFVVATGTSERQTKAIADAISQKLKELDRVPRHVEGLDTCKWVLLDYSDVVFHLFQPESREKYRLEKLWADAPIVPIETFGVSYPDSPTTA